MEVKSFTKNSNFTAVVNINGAEVTIDYSMQGTTPPKTFNLRSTYNDEGTSSTTNRTYDIERRKYSPVSKAVIYPFDTAFNDEVLTILDKIKADPNDPFGTIEAVEI